MQSPEFSPTAGIDRRAMLGGIAAAGALATLPPAQARAGSVQPMAAVRGQWIVTTEAAGWQPGATPRISAAEATTSFDLIIDPDKAHQTIEGFGACFNEMGWDALQILPQTDRDAIFAELFGEGGAGFTICRMPIGANDFSRDWYSYDETAADFALRNFSIANDETSLVPFIKAAKRVRPDLKLWASPWSPPSWMKTNGHYASVPNLPGRPANGLQPAQVGREGTDMMRQEPQYLDAYARYFGRFIDAYRKRGISIGMVMPQNEFNSAQPFPSCCWTPEGLARFLPLLGREMSARNVEIFFGTMEREDDRLFERVYADAPAATVIRGIGVQWAGKGALPYLHRQHPTLRIYQSEQECGDGKNDWRYARYAWSLMKTFLQNGANAYEYWNMALVDGGVSRWGWSQNSLVTVDKTSRTFRWNHEYWLMKHLSASVKPGARRIDVKSWAGYEDVLAFRNPDHTIAIIAHNALAVPLPVKMLLGSRLAETELPADSFASIVLAL
ncbi:glycoside hydrolase family 30 protein [Sphingomonas sp. ASY06-1R]|uniref:glycoside hydrolase family 30 protein n=1 Tax=Sphingomonas sp. ASY06-1R TaxID=3445771 RepID=UPI003FA22F6A